MLLSIALFSLSLESWSGQRKVDRTANERECDARHVYQNAASGQGVGGFAEAVGAESRNLVRAIF